MKTSEKDRERFKKYYQEHKEAMKAKSRKYDKDNSEKVKARQKAYREKHKEEKRLYQQIRHSKPEEKRRWREAGWKHQGIGGITFTDYEFLVEKQENRCACCKQTSERVLVPDHDHETGCIRGLLCRQCNLGIGCLGDTLEGVTLAYEYLGGKCGN